MPRGDYERKPRFKKATDPIQSGPTSAGGAHGTSTPETAEFDSPGPLQVPEHWSPGALLNVRNAGADYIVTLYPEEYDPVHPERAMRFPNPARCQDFVSKWYARQSHDPRAW